MDIVRRGQPSEPPPQSDSESAQPIAEIAPEPAVDRDPLIVRISTKSLSSQSSSYTSVGAGADGARGSSSITHAAIEPGTLADYRALSDFHYRSHRVGAASSVLRLVHRAPSVVGRHFARRDDTQVVGVLVRAMPALACSLRDVATANRYGGHLSQRERATLLNREVRCIARVVVDPRFRGLGLAVKLVAHALKHPENPQVRYTEALAAMGRVSPFFERAGMRRFDYPPRARPDHARLLDALEHAGLAPHDLASVERVMQRMHDLPSTARRWLLREFARFLRATRRIASDDLRRMSPRELIVAARQRLLLQPVYYIFCHHQPPC
jgi:GNAT superfamily N-acetyltransferase